MGIPTVLHEQNAVLGRANRFLAGDAEAIAAAYSEVERIKRRLRTEGRVWSATRCARKSPSSAKSRSRQFDEYAPFKILVTGGSQGATVLSKVVPEGLGLLSPVAAPAAAGHAAMPARTTSMRCARYSRPRHSGRADDLHRGHALKLAEAHLVIARSGASTVAELTAARASGDPHSLSGSDRRPSDRERSLISPRPAARG